MQLPELNSIAAFLALAAGFSFIIFVHELGHFLAAKSVGIKVTQFAIGFGHCLLSWRKGLGLRVGSSELETRRRLNEYLKSSGAAAVGGGEGGSAVYRSQDEDLAHQKLGLGETEYRFNWLPLGGYVKMLGQEDLDPEAASEDPRSFTKKPAWARALVISAGVIMNIIFGVIFFVIAFMAGVALPPAVVGDVMPGGPAHTAIAVGHEGDEAYRGLQPGDRVVRIGENEVMDFGQVQIAAGLAGRDEPLHVFVQRDGHDQPLEYRITPTLIPGSKLLSIGISSPASLRLAEDAELPPTLRQAGVVPGMAIAAVDGKPVQRIDQYERLITQAAGRALDVTFSDGQRQVVAPLAATPNLQVEDDVVHLLGVVAATEVLGTAEQSPARLAGLQRGDLLAQVGAVSWPSREQVSAIIGAANGQPVPIAVERDGQIVKLEPITPRRDGKLGIVLASAVSSNRIARVLPGSPLTDRRLTAGSRMLSVNGQPVTDLSQMQRLLAQAVADGSRQVTLGYEVNLTGKPQGEASITLNDQQVAMLSGAGWHEPLMAFEMLRTLVVAQTPWAATQLGLVKTHEFLLQTYLTLLRLFQGTVPVSELHGPVGIAHVGTRVAKQGWTYLLFFLGLISVNLAVINFLPIPIVDGGLMTFLIIEKLKGSPVSARVQTAATIVGLAMIASIFLVTLFYDVARLFN